jgi:hypothetical protein
VWILEEFIGIQQFFRRNWIINVPTGTVEIEPVQFVFCHRIQLSFPLSVSLFLTQFLKLVIPAIWGSLDQLSFPRNSSGNKKVISG